MKINNTPTASGNYGPPRSRGEGLTLPDALIPAYLDTMGFAALTLDGDTVTAVTKNEAAYDAYLASAPDPAPGKTLEERVQETESDIETLTHVVNILLGGGVDA